MSSSDTNEIVQACCRQAINPRNASLQKSYDPGQPNIQIPRRSSKGGSHLCAPNYCRIAVPKVGWVSVFQWSLRTSLRTARLWLPSDRQLHRLCQPELKQRFARNRELLSLLG